LDFEEIRYAVRDGIATITLHRPERLNAFTPKMLFELIRAFDQTDADDDVRVVIVTGEGRAFCAGADLGSGGDTFDSNKQGVKDTVDTHRDGGGLVTLRIYESKKPVIAAINGPAVGVGVTMTLPMDIRIASKSARFGFVFARRGIVPEAASSFFLPRLVGMERAAEWVYTGRVFDADEALAGRLVSRVVEPDQVVPAATALAREIADNTSAVSVALSRHLLWRNMTVSHPIEAHRIDSKCIFTMGRSPDAYEGVSAFLEKRPAKFPMKVSQDMPAFFPWWKTP
jgi:enoyl-CoA hydratase/carnithine racemase